MNHSVEQVAKPNGGWLVKGAHPEVDRVRLFEGWGYDSSVKVNAHVFPGEKPDTDMTFIDLNGSGAKHAELTIIDFCTKEGKPVDLVTHPQQVEHPQDAASFHARLKFSLGGNYQQFGEAFKNPWQPLVRENGSVTTPVFDLVERAQSGFEKLGYKPELEVARQGFVEAAVEMAQDNLDDDEYLSRVCDWMVTAYACVTTDEPTERSHSQKYRLDQKFWSKVNELVKK